MQELFSLAESHLHELDNGHINWDLEKKNQQVCFDCRCPESLGNHTPVSRYCGDKQSPAYSKAVELATNFVL